MEVKNRMAVNRFESSRVAAGTLNSGAQTLADTSHNVPTEPNALSRDDVRDGVAPAAGLGPNIIEATDLVGNAVRDLAGEDLGKIHQIMVDTDNGRIAYAVLSFGGFLKMGAKLVAVPWSALRFDRDNKGFVLDVDRTTLENAPEFDKDNGPGMANPHFATAWRHDVTDAGDYVGDNSQPNRSIEYEPVNRYRQAGDK
jgi:sporulation protein YlmC with PRC-barrel domain